MTRHILAITAAALLSGSAMAASSPWGEAATVYNDENGPGYPVDMISHSDQMRAPSRALLPEVTTDRMVPLRSESPATVRERTTSLNTYFRDENGYYPAQSR